MDSNPQSPVRGLAFFGDVQPPPAATERIRFLLCVPTIILALLMASLRAENARSPAPVKMRKSPATQTNRMSPTEIVMLYVSEDAETALRKTVDQPGARCLELALDHRLDATHPLTQPGFDWIKPIVEKMVADSASDCRAGDVVPLLVMAQSPSACQR
jgi:hypothetical protein